MIPAEWHDPAVLGNWIEHAYIAAETYLGHPPRDPLHFRRLVAESLFAKLRRDCHESDHAEAWRNA
jgi:hypothetical protein